MDARRTGRRLLVALIGGLAVSLLLNAAGVLRYPGGPLRYGPPPALWLDIRPASEVAARVSASATSAVGLAVGDGVLTTVFLPTDTPWSAIVERVELVGATPGLELASAWIARAGVDGPRPGLVAADAATLSEIERTHRPLPAEFGPGRTPDDGIIVLEVRATSTGSHEYLAVAVDYRIGPFSFRALHGPSLRLCIGPFEDGQACDWDEAAAD